MFFNSDYNMLSLSMYLIIVQVLFTCKYVFIRLKVFTRKRVTFVIHKFVKCNYSLHFTNLCIINAKSILNQFIPRFIVYLLFYPFVCFIFRCICYLIKSVVKKINHFVYVNLLSLLTRLSFSPFFLFPILFGFLTNCFQCAMHIVHV